MTGIAFEAGGLIAWTGTIRQVLTLIARAQERGWGIDSGNVAGTSHA